MGSFDRDMPAAERRRLLAFYADALRRHLYVHGQDKRLLSKNAAFASMANSLAAQFPDARFLVCLRDPLQTVPSQLSSIRAGLRFFGVPADSAALRERFIEQLAFYYRNLRILAETQAPARTVTTTLPQLKSDLAGTVRSAYECLGIPLREDFAVTLSAAAAPARAYRSSHRYQLSELGLDAATIARRFADAYPDPASAQVVPGAPESPPHQAADTPAAAVMDATEQAAGLSRC
jgi:hypothetical protein